MGFDFPWLVSSQLYKWRKTTVTKRMPGVSGPQCGSRFSRLGFGNSVLHLEGKNGPIFFWIIAITRGPNIQEIYLTLPLEGY